MGVSYCHSGKRSAAAVDTSLKQLIVHSSAVAKVANKLFGIVWGEKKKVQSQHYATRSISIVQSPFQYAILNKKLWKSKKGVARIVSSEE